MTSPITLFASCYALSLPLLASPFDQIGDAAVYEAEKNGVSYKYTFLGVGKDAEGRMCGEGVMESQGSRLVFDYVRLDGVQYEVATRLKSVSSGDAPRVARRKVSIEGKQSLVVRGMNSFFPTEFALKSESKVNDWKSARERNFYCSAVSERKRGTADAGAVMDWRKGEKNLFRSNRLYVFVCPEVRHAGFDVPVDLSLVLAAFGALPDGRVYGMGWLAVEKEGQEVRSTIFAWKQSSDVTGRVTFGVKLMDQPESWHELVLAKRDDVFQVYGMFSLLAKQEWAFDRSMEIPEKVKKKEMDGILIEMLMPPRADSVRSPQVVRRVVREDLEVVGKPTIKKDGEWVSIFARVQNNTDKEYESVFVSYTMLDAQGNPVGKTLGSVSNLKPGQSKVADSSGQGEGMATIELDDVKGYEKD